MLAVAIRCHNVAEKVRQIVTRCSDPKRVNLFATDPGLTDGTWEIIQELKTDGALTDVPQSSLGRCGAVISGASPEDRQLLRIHRALAQRYTDPSQLRRGNPGHSAALAL